MINNHFSLTTKIFLYFIIFAFLIVGIFWVLEIAVLDGFYAESKKQNCYDMAHYIEGNLKKYDRFEIDNRMIEIRDKFRLIESDNEMNIWLIKKNTNDLLTYVYGGNIPSNTIEELWDKIERSNLRENFEETDSNFLFSKIITLSDKTEVLLVLAARIVPIDSIVQVWRKQFYVISIIILALTAVFATIVSRNVSKPIASLNKAAKSLAKGNYDAKFDVYDYAEIKELADTLSYAQSELGKLDRYQKDLIANVSHDLRTPLTMIAGYSEMMQDYPSEMNKENLQIIIDEANRLTALVNDILNLTNMQNNAIKYQKENYNLTENIEIIISRNAKLLANVNCKVIFEKEQDVIINADILKIEIAIYNFLNNAVNYCGEDKLVIVRQKIENNKVKISFIDHGVGIDPEHINDIWNRYYKVNKNHNRGIGGSGLGLSIVKTVLEGHGFEYGVISEVGVGSEFWFSAPIIEILEEKNEE